MYRYTSSSEIISRIYRTFKPDKALPDNDIIEWVWEALQYVNASKQYEQANEEVKIENYKGLLPCDMEQFSYVTYKGYGIDYRPNEAYYTDQNNTEPPTYQPKQNKLTYDIRYPYIHTNLKEGTVIVYFNRAKLDKDGLPEIPDLEVLKQGIYWYVVARLQLSGQLKVPDGRMNYFYCDNKATEMLGKAIGQLNIPSIAELENFKREKYRVIKPRDHYKYGFRHMGNREATRLDGRFK